MSNITITIPEGRFALAARMERRLHRNCPSTRLTSDAEVSTITVDAAELDASAAKRTRWDKLRASINADLEKVKASDLTIDTNYAMGDTFRGVLAKMDALEPGGVWDD